MKLLTPALLLAVLCLPSAQARQGTPFPPTWGRFTLRYTPHSEPDRVQGTDAPDRLALKDGAKTVLTLSGWNLSVQMKPLRPGGLPELVVTDDSGGAHCCSTLLIYIYTQDRGQLENLGVLDGGNYGVRFQDLNGDGTKEIVVGGDTLAYYDWSFAASPALITVLGWDGVRLADRTRVYSGVPAGEAARNLAGVRKGLAAHLTPGSPDWETLKAEAAGYYANMILAGRGQEAERVLAAQVFPRSAGLRAWFGKHRGDLIGATYGEPEARLSILSGPVYPRPGR